MGRMGLLDGYIILIVEDDLFVAEDIAVSLQDEGAEVIGPAGSLAEAMDLASRTRKMDGAVLDVNLRRNKTCLVADLLRRRSVPFVFVTGSDEDPRDKGFRAAPILNKPVDMTSLVSALAAARSP
jgi:CheY-like chemotaxis protein